MFTVNMELKKCPINIYKNLDLCCKPLLCTVIPKTCKPNFINRYFNISDYKDRRCKFPSKTLASSELQRQNVVTPGPLNSTGTTNQPAVRIEFMSDFSNVTEYFEDINGTSTDISYNNISNKTISTIPNQIYSSNETEYYESKEESTNSPLEPWSHGSSLLDSQSYFIDSNNEIRQLVKRYVSNHSSSESHLSISSTSLERGYNFTLRQDSQFENTSHESVSSSESSPTQADSRESDSGSVSGSGEVYDYDNETKIGEFKQNFTYDLTHGTSGRIYSTTTSTLAESEEDWHSSDMKYDSRPKVYKVVTVHPLGWFQTGAKQVKLNLSSEISE